MKHLEKDYCVFKLTIFFKKICIKLLQDSDVKEKVEKIKTSFKKIPLYF